MMGFHLGAVAALFFFNWKAVAVAAVLWFISGALGIGMPSCSASTQTNKIA